MLTSSFTVNGTEYPYNRDCSKNERAIELPWIRSKTTKMLMLEVGNCLREAYSDEHWIHPVVCKYDSSDDQDINRVDILDFKDGHYGQIVSVSTFEHIGKDYGEVWAPERGLEAIEHCKSLLIPGGHLDFTIPVGWNHPLLLDEAICENKLGLSDAALMVRIDTDNNWEQRPLADNIQCEYPGEFGDAGAVLLCSYVRPYDKK